MWPKALAIVTLGQATFGHVGLYFDKYVAEARILKMSSDFWFLTKVIRKRGRDTRVSPPSGEGRFAIICFTLMSLYPNSGGGGGGHCNLLRQGVFEQLLYTEFNGLFPLV
jgi:hypothetical protein